MQGMADSSRFGDNPLELLVPEKERQARHTCGQKRKTCVSRKNTVAVKNSRSAPEAGPTCQTCASSRPARDRGCIFTWSVHSKFYSLCQLCRRCWNAVSEQPDALSQAPAVGWMSVSCVTEEKKLYLHFSHELTIPVEVPELWATHTSGDTLDKVYVLNYSEQSEVLWSLLNNK